MHWVNKVLSEQQYGIVVAQLAKMQVTAHKPNLHFCSHLQQCQLPADPITESPQMTATVRIEFRNGRFKTAYDRTLDGYVSLPSSCLANSYGPAYLCSLLSVQLTEAEFARRVSTLNVAARSERLKGSSSALALFCTLLVIVFLITLLLVLRGLTMLTVTGILIVGIPIVFGSLLFFCIWTRLYKNQVNFMLKALIDFRESTIDF